MNAIAKELIHKKTRYSIYMKTKYRYLRSKQKGFCQPLKEVISENFPEINRRYSEKDYPKLFPELWRYKPNQVRPDGYWWDPEDPKPRIIFLNQAIRDV